MMQRHKLIFNLCEQLDNKNIGYVILRNYDFLIEGREPRKTSEYSIDMMISQEDYTAFDLLMKENGFLQRRQQFSHAHKAYFMIDRFTVISFDVQVGGIHWNDMRYLDAKEVLSHRKKLNSFSVLHDTDMYVMLLLHSVLGKRYFKEEYKTILKDLRTYAGRDDVLIKLQKVLPQWLAKQLFFSALDENYGKIISQRHIFICSFIFYSPRNIVIFTALFFRWIKWKKFFKNYPLISIIGPDGAGKSTLAEALVKYLQQHHRKAVLSYTGRGRGQLLPVRTLGNVYKYREKKKDSTQQPSLGKRRVIYTLAAPIFAMDLWLRYPFRIWPLRQRRTIVVTDRYCTDILLMEHVPFRFKSFLFRFFPVPTMTFLLYHSAEVLHERREEESVQELERQLALFEQMSELLPLKKILTNGTENVNEEVFATVMNYLYTEWF